MNVYIKEPKHPAQACVIWMHGLGADASDMAGLAEQLNLNEIAVRHVFLDAPLRPVTLNNGMVMRAWYDIIGLKVTDREDQEGILQTVTLIREVVEQQVKEGFTTEKIFLAGFSQGGAIALYTALQSNVPFAGIISLSAYLPLADNCKTEMPKNTPVFVAGGQYDPLVLPAWTKGMVQWLDDNGYKEVTFKSYLMEHAVCAEEIRDISIWLSAQVKGGVQ